VLQRNSHAHPNSPSGLCPVTFVPVSVGRAGMDSSSDTLAAAAFRLPSQQDAAEISGCNRAPDQARCMDRPVAADMLVPTEAAHESRFCVKAARPGWARWVGLVVTECYGLDKQRPAGVPNASAGVVEELGRRHGCAAVERVES
jgi:hypothetical protein